MASTAHLKFSRRGLVAAAGVRKTRAVGTEQATRQ